MNRLLINMENKINDLTSALNMIERLLNGETVTANGINKIVFSYPQSQHDSLLLSHMKIYNERENLRARVMRMKK